MQLSLMADQRVHGNRPRDTIDAGSLRKLAIRVQINLLYLRSGDAAIRPCFLPGTGTVDSDSENFAFRIDDEIKELQFLPLIAFFVVYFKQGSLAKLQINFISTTRLKTLRSLGYFYF